MIVLFCLAVGSQQAAFSDAGQSADHPLAGAAHSHGRDGPDDGDRLPPCRSLDRLDPRPDGDGLGHDVPLSSGNLVAARLRAFVGAGRAAGLVQRRGRDPVPAARHYRHARHAQSLSRPDVHSIGRQADRPSICADRAEGDVADLADFRHTLDHPDEFRGGVAHLLFCHAHPHRAADLRSRLQSDRGAAARNRCDEGDAAGLRALGRIVGSCRHHVCEPLGFRESVQHRHAASSFRSSPPSSSAAFPSTAASARSSERCWACCCSAASRRRFRCSGFPARPRMRSMARSFSSPCWSIGSCVGRASAAPSSERRHESDGRHSVARAARECRVRARSGR